MKQPTSVARSVKLLTVEVLTFSLLSVPVVFSILKSKIVEFVGYAIFLLGGFSPHLYEKIVCQKLDVKVKFGLSSTVVLHSFFGQFLDFYEYFPGWDKLLHFCGSFVITIFFFETLRQSSKFWNAKNIPDALFMAFLLGAFAGLVWEIAEYVADKIFPYIGAQRGLDDTMMDFVFNVLGCYSAVQAIKYSLRQYEVRR